MTRHESDGESSVDFDGYDIQAGLRWKLLQWLEASGQGNWVDYGDGGDDFSGEVGALGLFLNDRIGLGASYEVGNNSRTRLFLR